MHRIAALLIPLALILVSHTAIAGAQQAQAMAPEVKIENALSAAPSDIAEYAAVIDWDGTVLQAGTNGWTCFPDPPQGPGDTPFCMNPQAMKWMEAWENKRAPQLTQTGITYMLRGGFAPSNTDPYAAEPAPGDDWITHGPHIIITPPDVEALTNLLMDPHSGSPWVMWQGTRYAHLHLPLGQ